MLTCAERLLADGKRADAQTLYQLLAITRARTHSACRFGWNALGKEIERRENWA
jgi:hypothetical protein